MQFFKGAIFFVAFFLAAVFSEAQELIQMSIHSDESFYVHPSGSIGIFSDVRNSGSLGSYPNSTINFFGQRWRNLPDGRLPDEGPAGIGGQGGYIRFSSLNNSAQFIENQNIPQSVNGFPNITIANAANVTLEGSDLIIRKNLNFESGRLILNSRNVVLPVTASITGFDGSRFIVTGTGTNGGYLVRSTSGLAQPDLVFPVGTTVNSYTPAAVNYRGVAQNIKVRVFDNVYDKAVFGIPDNINYAPKTWNVSFGASDPSAVMTLNTQHNASEEGTGFAARRLESYISRYLPSTEQWDKVAPTAIRPGSLTTGNVIPGAYLNSRAAISGVLPNEYFSKSIVSNTTATSGLRIPAGISPNNDGLNEKFIIENLKAGDRVRLDIYNRWQTLVFRDGNYKNTFDGTGNQKGLVNNQLPDGTYYYILNINTEKPVTGYIVINR